MGWHHKKESRRARHEVPQSVPRQRGLLWAAAAVLALAVLLTYSRSIDGGFLNTWDDKSYVVDNPDIKGLSWHTLAWSFSESHSGNWHPLTWLSHALDCELYGLEDASGHHRTNVLLHAANAVLLLVALRRLSGRLWASAAVAALFALHPLRVESVAWIAQRKDLLCAMFTLLMLWAYAVYAQEPSPRPFWFRRSYWLMVAAFAAALLSKPMAVTLPLLLLVLDWWPLRRLRWSCLWEKLPLLAMSGLACWATVWAQGSAGAMRSLETLSFGARLLNAAMSYARYLAKMFWPWPGELVPFYPLPADGGPAFGPAAVAAAAGLLLALTIVALVFHKRKPYLLAGWLWFVGMLVPVIGLVQVGFQAMADRYTYLPAIGLLLAAVWLVDDLTAGRAELRRLVAALAVAVLVALAGLSLHQQKVWHDSRAFWQYVARAYPGNWLARYNLGLAYAELPDDQQVLACYREAVRLNPAWPQLRHSLANALGRVGQLDAAIAEYRTMLRDHPEMWQSRLNLGLTLFEKGELEEAVREYRALLKEHPEMMEAHQNLGAALAKLGDSAGAANEFAEAERLKRQQQAKQ